MDKYYEYYVEGCGDEDNTRTIMGRNSEHAAANAAEVEDNRYFEFPSERTICITRSGAKFTKFRVELERVRIYTARKITDANDKK